MINNINNNNNNSDKDDQALLNFKSVFAIYPMQLEQRTKYFVDEPSGFSQPPDYVIRSVLHPVSILFNYFVYKPSDSFFFTSCQFFIYFYLIICLCSESTFAMSHPNHQQLHQ